MNNDTELIGAALDRRFGRVTIPACPEGVWHAAKTGPAKAARPSILRRRFAYAAALLGAVAVGGLAAQASGTMKSGYPNFLWGSSKPLMPLIHAADRLTIAEAQRQMPFSIVVPTGLPAHTRFLYAHVLGNKPVPRVALSYEAHVAKRYYRVSITESTVAVGPPVAHFELRTIGGSTKKWTLQMRRWKHGDVVMDLFAPELPSELSDQIVRANTI
jgi:hypothetical protein